MKKKSYKVVIVGAGPIGCYLAQLLKRKGLNPLLLEEHKSIGRPVHCAGFVGNKVFDEIKFPLKGDFILNSIHGAVFHLAEDNVIVKKKKVAYVIDRERFDTALGKGLDVHFERKFLGLERMKGHYIIETDKGDLDADIVIGADGAQSSVRTCVTPQRINFLKGVQFRMRCQPRYKDMVEVFIKKPYFYWIIPETEKSIRIGVMSDNPYYDLLDFIKEKKLKGKVIEKFAGIVPLTHFTPLSDGRIFLVGDSAAQLKPLTYGGIFLGMRAAEILSDCIIEEKFSRYNSLWLKKFRKSIGIILSAKHVLSHLADKDVKKIFAFIKENTALVEKEGDFENHSMWWECLKHAGANSGLWDIFFKIIKSSVN